MKSLFAMLRKIEEGGERLSADELDARAKQDAGYKGIRTYLSKYLKPIVQKQGDGLYEVSGALGMSEAEFAALLTQNKGATAPLLKYGDRDEWAAAVLNLVVHGRDRGFELKEAERLELLDLLE
jgi:hypothetical protein